jgi:pyruvate ferredoxin oxidoreductase delta subunit
MFGPLTVRPQNSKGSKTGSWRVQLRPKYLHQNCIACKLCSAICPEGCISGKEKNTFLPDYDYCKGCGLCAKACPKQDVEMVLEEGAGKKQ